VRPPESNFPNCLKPHFKGEAISLTDAAEIAGRSLSTVRGWCNQYGIGRRIVGGKWDVSRVALGMLMDDERAALKVYLSGERQNELVKNYFDRYGIEMKFI
jgi:hypothetical protein